MSLTDSLKKGSKDPKDDQLIALVEAFQSFNRSSSTLNQAYRRLERVAENLAKELEETNAVLKVKNRELDCANRYLEDILSSIGTGVIAVDLEGRITIFNRTAEEMTGYARDEVIGKNYHDLFTGELGENAPLMQTMITGAPVEGMERDLPVKSGEPVPVKSSSLWITSSSGERIGMVETFEDISRVRELEQRVLHHKTLAALGEMAAQVAHELRNPLAGIKGFAGLLEEDLRENESAARMVRRIIEGVDSLDRIATNLLVLTQESPGDLQRKPLEPIFDQSIALTVSGCGNDFNIETDFPQKPVAAKVDEEKIKQLLLNLLRNAREAAGSQGKVITGYRANPLTNELKIFVRDFGPGVPEEVRDKIFNPFFTTKTRGTGLGLAIAKKIAEMHRGRIEYTSPEDGGSLFTVTLPII